MGFIRSNNESSWELDLSYNKNEPFWKVLNWHNEISFEYSSLYKPRKYTDFEISMFTGTTFAKRYLHTGLFVLLRPVEGADYFEPRVDGWKFNTPRMTVGNWWISTDYRKMFASSLRVGGWKALDFDRYGWWLGIGPRIRFSDRWLLTYDLNFDGNFNTYGYIEDYTEGTATVINFGKRDQQTIINALSTNYIFNNKMSLSLRVRHYWSRVEYDNFYTLQEDGTLSDALGYETYGADMNYNFNAFTIDMKYLWRFAPGSEMSLVWKNSIFASETDIVNNFFDNLNNTFESSQINSISLKILYYLDYQYLVKK